MSQNIGKNKNLYKILGPVSSHLTYGPTRKATQEDRVLC